MVRKRICTKQEKRLLLLEIKGMMDSPLGASGNAGAMAGISDSLRQKGIPPVITTDPFPRAPPAR